MLKLRVLNFHLVLFVLFLIFFVEGNLYLEDYKSHPCIRKCDNNTARMLCEYNWTIEWYSTMSKACLDCPLNKTSCDRWHCVSANGVLRPIITINRKIPGPSLIVCQHDIIKINLYNSLHMSEGTSIHWHGLNQRGTQYMDGVSMVTQCPVNSHSHFEYRFNANEVGTHLWHSHSGLQRADGVFGPIVVHEYENDNPYIDEYDYDLPEHVITVNDWINDTSIAKFSGHHHNDGDNKPSSILINGKGVLKEFLDPKGNRIRTPRAVFYVEKGKKYRFRVINAGILYCPIEISFEGHSLLIIASDGKYLEAFQTETFVIYAGERIDFILEANQVEKNFWIRAKGLADCNVFKAYQTAILSYKINGSLNEIINEEKQPKYEDSRLGMKLNPWNTIINSSNQDIYCSIDQLKAVETPEVENVYSKIINATKVKRHYLAMEFNQINNPEFNDEKFYSLNMMSENNRTSLFTPQINNISFHMPDRPVLYEWDSVPRDMICNHMNKDKVCAANVAYCSCVYLLEFDIDDVVEFVIVDEGFTFQSNHPMHLHGTSFAVLAVKKLNRSIKMANVKELDEKGLLERNLDRPPIKDTVTVPVGGYTIIRFLADNPGTWMFHCHLDFHSEVGMALLVKIGEKKDLPREPKGWPKCGSFAFVDNSSFSSTLSKSTVFLVILIQISIKSQ